MIANNLRKLYYDTFKNASLTSKEILIGFLPIIGLMILINIILTINFGSNGTSLDGSLVEARSPEMIRAIIRSSLFSFPLLSMILGLLFALIPFKGLRYSQRLLRVSLYLLFSINFMIMVVIIYRIVLGNI